MRTPVWTLLLLGAPLAFLSSARAEAAEIGSPGQTVGRARAPKLRIGSFIGGAIGSARGHADFGSGPPPEDAGPGKVNIRPFPLPMLGLNLGIQVDERTALYFRGEMASLLLLNLTSVSLILEANLSPRWAVGGGLGVAGMNNIFLGICWPACPGPNSHDWSGISVPLLLTYSFRAQVESSWRATLEGALGTDPRDLSELSQRLSFALGYDWM